MARMRKRQALELLVEGGAASAWDDRKWTACLSKVSYPTQDHAMRALRHLPKSKGELRPYVCSFATDGHLHVTASRP